MRSSRPIAAALLAGAGCFALIARHPRSCQQEPSGPPQDRVEDVGAADYRPPSAAPKHPLPALSLEVGQQRTGRDEHTHGNGRRWSRGEVIAVVSAAATLAGAVFAAFAFVAALQAVKQASRQADIAKDSYLATTRAWFDVGVDLSDLSLKWKEGVGATLYARTTGTNNGNSPAISVSLSSNLEVDRGVLEFPRRDIIKESCTQWRPLSGGDIVFMKEPIEHYGPAFAAWHEIIAPIDEGAERSNQLSDSVAFYVVACAMYRIVGDDNWHYTARVLRVLRVDDPDGTRVSHLLKIGEDLEDGRLTLVREGGAYAD